MSRGGKGEGAGRKGFGTTKKVSITLPDEYWEFIDKKPFDSQSAFWRHCIAEYVKNIPDSHKVIYGLKDLT